MTFSSMSPIFRSGFCAFALLAGGALLSSCGGGSSGGNLATPTAIPSATATSGSAYTPSGCTATTYSPNYITSNSGDSGFTYWQHFPITVYIAPTDAATRAATVAGFNEWVSATGGKASYKVVSSSTGADLSVSFEALAADSSTLGLTTVYYNGNVIDHDTMQLFVYNSDGSVNTAQNQSGTNQTIAAHEFGHALGIGPHSLVSSDLMYYAISGDEGIKPVSTRDLNTLKTIYCNNFPTASALHSLSSGPLKSLTSPPLQRAKS